LLLGRGLLGLGTLLLGLLLLLLGLLGSLGLSGLGTVVLGGRCKHGLLLLGLDDGDGVGKTLGTRLLAGGVVGGGGGAHDLDLDTEDTLAEEDVAGGVVNEVLSGLTGVDHEAVGELHGLGTSGAQLAGDDNLATLGTRLHNETEDTVACTTDGKTVEELVTEGLALGDSGETAGLDLGGVEGDAVGGELVTVGDQAGKLADPATLLTKNLLGVGGADDDVGDGRGHTDLNTGVSLLSKLALEELVQLGVEDTVSNELAALGEVGAGVGHGLGGGNVGLHLGGWTG